MPPGRSAPESKNGRMWGWLQPGGEADLPRKRSAPSDGGELRAQHLERHRAVVAEVVGQVDGGHAAAAELALDPVAVGQSCLQLKRREGQRRRRQ